MSNTSAPANTGETALISEMLSVLGLIMAEWDSDVRSTQCFDSRIITQARIAIQKAKNSLSAPSGTVAGKPDSGIEKASSESVEAVLQKKLEGATSAYDAARQFIEGHVADPDITDEMCRRYAAYQVAKQRFEKLLSEHSNAAHSPPVNPNVTESPWRMTSVTPPEEGDDVVLVCSGDGTDVLMKHWRQARDWQYWMPVPSVERAPTPSTPLPSSRTQWEEIALTYAGLITVRNRLSTDSDLYIDIKKYLLSAIESSHKESGE